jgi:hypothetical protein
MAMPRFPDICANVNAAITRKNNAVLWKPLALFQTGAIANNMRMDKNKMKTFSKDVRIPKAPGASIKSGLYMKVKNFIGWL